MPRVEGGGADLADEDEREKSMVGKVSSFSLKDAREIVTWAQTERRGGDRVERKNILSRKQLNENLQRG